MEGGVSKMFAMINCWGMTSTPSDGEELAAILSDRERSGARSDQELLATGKERRGRQEAGDARRRGGISTIWAC